jgi:hypothetical protein
MVGLLALAGCGAEHLTVTQGKATSEYYRAQLVNPEAGAKSAAILGLDSTEAAIVAKNYYDSLVAEGGEAAQGEQVLIVSPTKEADAKLPPPSVPEGTR